MYLEEEYRIYHVRSGQPRPYAHTEYVHRVERWEHHRKWDRINKEWYTTCNLAYPERKEFVDGEVRDVDPKEEMLNKVKHLFARDFKFRSDIDSANADDYFAGWYEVDYPEPGVMEVKFISPYTD